MFFFGGPLQYPGTLGGCNLHVMKDVRICLAVLHLYFQLRLGKLTNRLSDKGVKAILQRCRNLESLDVRECCFVKLDTETRNLCARLKMLIRPGGKLSEENEFASEAERERPLDLYDDDYYNEGYHIDGDDFFDYLSS
jgi:hypothetical protein